MPRALPAALLLAGLLTLGCGAGGPEPDTGPRPEATTKADGSETRAEPAEARGAPAGAARADTVERDGRADRSDRARLEALYRARVDSARMRHTEADVRFMQGMILHHGQALVMASLAHDADRGASPALQRMAERIRISQEDEIALMQRWLRTRDLPTPEVEVEGTRLAVHGIDERADHHDGALGQGADEHGHGADEHGNGAGARGPVDGTHGMLTQAELDELGEQRGGAFDRLFLTYMIRHHRGAVTMVHELFDTPGAARDPEIFRLASDIQADQLTEIARMEQMLQQMSGPGDGL